MTTRVRVAVRSRPLIGKEKAEGCQPCITVIGDNQIMLGKEKCFTYDYVFGMTTAQEDVFHSCAYPLVEAIFKGFNATMLAYGQTGSGKTYTMGTGKIVDRDEQVLGIIPRVVEELFSQMEERQDKYTYSTRVSFLEIYNEELKDLLSSDSNGNSASSTQLAIREDESSIKISGLTEEVVTSPTEALNLLCRGGDSRAIGSTKMNEQSSRSHAIFSLHIEQRSNSEPDDFWTAKFHLVDLAGSERVKKTGAEGDRLKEGININLGLLALGNVVSALGDEKKKRNAVHIPYRDSKLTRLLQDSLGGNSYTLMMACISPADSNQEETLNTLRYADRAKRIKNKPIVNRDPQVAEILRLKALVAELQSGAVTGSLSSQSTDPLSSLEVQKFQEKYKLLEEQNQKLTMELTNAIDHSSELCEKIVLVEMSRDKLKSQLSKITLHTGISLEELDNSLQDPDLKPELRERLEKVKGMQEEMARLDSDKAALEVSLSEINDNLTTITELSELSTSTGNSPPSTANTSSTITQAKFSAITDSANPDQLTPSVDRDGDEAFANAYMLHRAKMSRQLKELNDMLSAKEALMSESVSSEQRAESLKKQQQLEAKIKHLEDERDSLQRQVTSSKTSSNIGKISEQRRQRLKELESQMSELKNKLREQSRIVKMKEQTDKQLDRLNKEIVGMKQHRVKLLKQIKEESENFRRWKMEQDKKVMQLKARDRKMQYEISKLESQHTKAQAYFKRKTEEASLANKRLKEALERQQNVRQMNSARQNERELSNVGPRIKSLVNDELDIQISIKEAERLLQDQTNHRAEISKELQSLNSNAPPHHLSSRDKVEERRKLLSTQHTLCNAQIAQFNQKLQDAKSHKTQPLSEKVTSMVEARCTIRHLFNTAVRYQLDMLEAQRASKDNECTAHKVSDLEKELTEMEDYHANEIKLLKQDFDRKTATMKKQLQKAGGSASQLSVNSMELNITELNDELEEKNKEISELKRKLDDAAKLCHPTPPILSNDPGLKTPKSGVPGERFPALGISPSPFTSKVKVSIKPKEAEANVKVRAKVKYSTVPESEDMDTTVEEDFSDSDVENDDPADLSWHATPEVKRMRRMSSFTKCTCTTKCSRKSCSCRVRNRPCGPLCGCILVSCQNPANSHSNSPNTTTTATTEDASSTGTTVLNETFTFTNEDDADTPTDSSAAVNKSAPDDTAAHTHETDHKKLSKKKKAVSTSSLHKKRKLHDVQKQSYYGSPV